MVVVCVCGGGWRGGVEKWGLERDQKQMTRGRGGDGGMDWSRTGIHQSKEY